MKILLTAVNAKYIHSNLAVYSLAAYAKEYKAHLKIAEYTINHYKEDILEGIYREKADVVVFSCYIWNISIIEAVMRLLKKAAPKTKIWLGGPEVSYDAPEFLKSHPEADGIMCGEGEETFKQLVRYYVSLEQSNSPSGDKKHGSLSEIRGIVYRDGGIVVNPPAVPVNMDTLPFIYDDLSLFEHKIIYYESSRGCPFSCSYCLSSIDKNVRFKNTELVKAELMKLIEAKVPQVKFVDRTFNCRHKHTMEIWQFIKAHDNGVTNFHFEITADLINDEEIALLNTMRPGLVQLEIGVQSTNRETLREIRRVMDFKDLSSVVKKIDRGQNVHQHLDLIAGLPYEDLERFKQSFNDVYSLKPEQLQLGFLKVLKGSWLYQNREAYGLVYQPDPVYEVMSTKWLSFDDILHLKGIEAVVEIFYNSHQFDKSVAFLSGFFKTPFDFYEALAAFYEARGLKQVNHKRITRYEHLLEFSKNYTEETALVKELLIYDLYAREHLKTRPLWAKSQEGKKEEIADFYSSEAEKYVPSLTGLSYRKLRFESHLEFFDYDLKAAWEKGEIHLCKNRVLFNYAKRSPLTYEAETVHISG